MEIGSQWLAIGENLNAALLMLRNSDSARTIWVDAICINQDDVNERNHQVHIMRKIYSNAASVIVWLGPESKSSRAAMDLIITCNQSSDDELLHGKENALMGLSDIFQRSWWKRIWIVQEAVVARELVIFCGNYILPWSFISRVCVQIRRNEFSRDARSQLLRSSGYRNFTALEGFRREHGTTSLTKYLKCTRDYEASDMRDKLYALIGVASDISPEDIVPDYTKPTRTVFLDLVHFLVTKRHSLDIIASGRHIRPASMTDPSPSRKPGDETPSWLPEWRVSQGLRPLDSEGVDSAFYYASRGAKAVVKMHAFPLTLEVEGVVVDKIDFFGGAITSSAQDSLPTLRRWQYIAGQHLNSASNFGAKTPPEFWTTIVAGKNYLSTWNPGELPPKALEALGTGAQSFIAGDTSQDAWVTKYFSDAITRAVIGRRFFITQRKRMGLSVPEIQLKDRVVVVKGCSVPLVLRSVGDHMVIVGESYVSGIMNGEVMQGLAAGKYATRMIRLR